MKQKQIFFALLFSIFYSNILQAQVDSSIKAKPQFKLSLIYNSNLNYYGRTDSLKSNGFFPLAEFWISPNFYVNAAPIFVNNSVQSFDYAGTVTTVGYQQVTSKWITAVSILKPFYEQSSTLLPSALKAQANISITKLNKVANVTVGADAKFSDKTDFGATAGIDHIFTILSKKGGVWVLDPSFYSFGGTRQFSRTYTKQQEGLLPASGGSTQESESYSRFSVLAYEASMPVIFIKEKIMLMVTPSYVLPQNLLTDPSNPQLSERGENTYYTTFGIKYTF